MNLKVRMERLSVTRIKRPTPMPSISTVAESPVCRHETDAGVGEVWGGALSCPKDEITNVLRMYLMTIYTLPSSHQLT